MDTFIIALWSQNREFVWKQYDNVLFVKLLNLLFFIFQIIFSEATELSTSRAKENYEMLRLALKDKVKYDIEKNGL